MSYTAHVDSFARDNLPPKEQWPAFLFGRPELQYPARLNACTRFLDRWIAAGRGDAPCLVGPAETLTYGELDDRVNRIANVLTGKLGLVPGGRVLLRAANTPMWVAVFFAVLKAGGVVVATMPMLRAREIAYPLDKAKIGLALCDHRLSEELEKARPLAPGLARVVYWGGGGPDSLEALMADASPRFEAVETAADDVCLIAFTSGTTGEPKGTMHFHRDLVAICDAYSDNVLRPEPSDRFIGSPPLAFTFGLGALALFPMHVGAATVLIEKATPDELLPAIAKHRATVCVTAPTAYRAMLARLGEHDVSSLRKCVSAGEALPKATFDAGGRDLPPGAVGRLAVRGPTGCRYLADERQRKYVEDGWNLTGDTYLMDEDGYFWYQARSDDMIISAGYNIAGPEVEAALLTHPAVAECGVVGAPDPERGMIVTAFVVLSPGERPGPETAKALQDHVKQEIAPYKYPRAIAFVAELPKTATGKLQRFALRQMAQAASKASAA